MCHCSLAPPLVVKPREGSPFVLLDLVIRRSRNAFLCPASGSCYPQTDNCSSRCCRVRTVSVQNECRISTAEDRIQDNARYTLLLKISNLWYILGKKTILICSHSRHILLTVKIDKIKISLLFAPLLYITFLLSGNMPLILWPFLLKVLEHTLTIIISFSFSNLKDTIPDVDQYSSPEHNLFKYLCGHPVGFHHLIFLIHFVN